MEKLGEHIKNGKNKLADLQIQITYVPTKVPFTLTNVARGSSLVKCEWIKMGNQKKHNKNLKNKKFQYQKKNFSQKFLKI